jgi:hypothetical protein
MGEPAATGCEGMEGERAVRSGYDMCSLGSRDISLSGSDVLVVLRMLLGPSRTGKFRKR